ncbi:MAG: hypothetical protein PHG19_04750 [Anaerotignum sp.]|nr:hypothetical protein [Anaerotignum sp.]
MWKLFIEYSDRSKCTITGKQPDISLELAWKCKMQYANGTGGKATYQRYPKSKYQAVSLDEKIEKLEEEGAE